LYFFRAPKELVEEKRRNSQRVAHQAFQLAPGRPFPPELFDAVTRNLSLEDIPLARGGGEATAELPLPVHFCDTINIDFDIVEGCSQRELQAFEKRTFPLIENLLRECAKNGSRIGRVVINPGGLNALRAENADLGAFFRFARSLGSHFRFGGYQNVIRNLLESTQELSFPVLELTFNSLEGIKYLLREYPKLKIVVQRLQLKGHRTRGLPVLYLSNPLAERVHIQTVESDARANHELANMLTAHHPLHFLPRVISAMDEGYEFDELTDDEGP
jgi:hypothetical protein